MISAETYKVLTIISEFTKWMVWALDLIYCVTWYQIFIESPSMMNLQELNYTLVPGAGVQIWRSKTLATILLLLYIKACPQTWKVHPGNNE